MAAFKDAAPIGCNGDPVRHDLWHILNTLAPISIHTWTRCLYLTPVTVRCLHFPIVSAKNAIFVYLEQENLMQSIKNARKEFEEVAGNELNKE